MIKVLLADRLGPRAVELLKEIPEFDIVERTGADSLELESQIKTCDAVVVRSATRLSRDVLERAEQLKLIVRAGIGLDNVDIDAAGALGVEVRNTPQATSITVAEYTLALMLAVCRGIGPAYCGMKQHRWEKQALEEGTELYGKTAGIIGFGRIGRELARRELALGMEVIFQDVLEIETDMQVKQVSLEELLNRADFISIHLPLTESTRHLISAAELGRMKPQAVLINVSRGGVVDETALLAALESGKLRAAALDVYEQEPPDRFDLIDHDRVFPSPHLGASTVEKRERAGLDVITILKDFFNV